MPETRGQRQAAPNELSPALRRRLDARLRSLRLGATCFALLGGLAVYYFLTQRHVAGAISVGAGLLYAILVRIAVISLARDWLVHAAARLRDESEREQP